LEKKNFRIYILIAAAAAVILEVFVFNCRALIVLLKGQQTVSLSLEENTDLYEASLDGGTIVLDGPNPSVTFSNVNTEFSTITLDAVSSDSIITADVSLTDASHTDSVYTLGSYSFQTEVPESMVFAAGSRGRAMTLRLTFSTSSSGLRIRSIVLNNPGFHFSKARFFFFFLSFLLLALIFYRRAWKIPYDAEDRTQNLIWGSLVFLLCILPILLALPFANASGFNLNNIEYPLTGDVDDYGIYVQQFDAFQKGQLNLDLPVDDALSQIDDPYDSSQMISSGIDYPFDRAFYHGKYYSYYGITPLLTVYYPYYFLTGALPSDLCAAMIITPAAVLVLALLLRESLLHFLKKINYLLLLFGTAGTVFVSLLYVMEVSTSFYCMPYFSCILFSALFLLLFFRAVRKECRRPAVYFLFSGISYVLAVGSRPLSALFLLLILPQIIGILKDRGLQKNTKILRASAFAVPVVCGAALLMMYNYLRFHSPLEFGISYQLTVTNPQLMTFEIYDIVPAIYHYFLQLPTIDPNFPFFHAALKLFSSYDGYKYESAMVGAFAFPMLWWLFAVFSKKTHRGREERYFKTAVLAISLFMAVASFSMSGFIIRYVTDYQWLLAILAVLLMMESCESDALPVIAIIFSVVIVCALLFSNENNMILRKLPNVYTAFQRLCEWR
jgi:hypothetical protein